MDLIDLLQTKTQRSTICIGLSFSSSQKRYGKIVIVGQLNMDKNLPNCNPNIHRHYMSLLHISAMVTYR